MTCTLEVGETRTRIRQPASFAGLAKAVVFSTWFCISGGSIYGRIQISHCELNSNNHGISMFFLDLLAACVSKI